ncbi:MAG: hypothetical protein ABIK10_02520 [candidate division WOR-3 bacterium]
MRIILITLSVFCFLNAQTTFFSEDFDSPWTTSSPPTGWTIRYDPPSGPDDWHRAISGYWSTNSSGYALISYDQKNKTRLDNNIDSLISPIIDCSRYRNIIMRCSLYFQHNTGNYTAKIIGSTDGGITYPYLIKDLYGHYFNPQLETIALDWANEESQVRIAFVFEGEILNINFWCLDNLSLVGDWVYDFDVAPVQIIKPTNTQIPGRCTLQVKIANLGKETAYNFSVGCSLYNIFGMSLHYAEANLESITPHETLSVSLLPAYDFPSIPSFYSVKFWTNFLDDENRSNDTIQKTFSVTWTEILNYSDDIPDTGLFLPTCDEGWGVKFTPSNYPALINNVQCYFGEYLYTPYRYKIRIVDDDGPGGAPNSIIYETPPIATSNPGWKTAYLSTEEIYIDSGSVYIFYIQADDAPYTPLFFLDAHRDSTDYYRCQNDQYIPIYPPGDLLMRVCFEYRPLSRPYYDLRVVNIETPKYEFVRRPYNYQIPVLARIGNFGLQSIYSFGVACTISSYIGGYPGAVRKTFYQLVPALAGTRETIINLGNWQVIYTEPVLVTVRVILGVDQNPVNNRKEKIINIYSGKFTANEGVIGYAWIDSDTTTGPDYNWYEVTNAYQLLDYGDDTVFAAPLLPFDFPFYDTTYRTVYISTNGFLGFSSDLLATPENDTIPSTTLPNGAIYAFWDDLVLPADRTAKIYYQDLGAPPNRFRVITWHNILRKNTQDTCRLNFQVILYENGDIVYQYKNLVTGETWADYGKSATVGIENSDGTSGLLYLYGGDRLLVNWPENKLASGRAIKFYKQKHDVGIVTIISPKDSIFPLPTTPQIKIKNYGTTPEETVATYLKILDALSNIVYDTFLYCFYLPPNTEFTITFGDWNAYSGRYSLICSTQISIDDNPSNNVITKSIYVAPWLMKSSIPSDDKNLKVKNGALAYAPDFRRIYALKGNVNNEFYAYNLETDQWESLPRLPLWPSNKKPKAGCALTFGMGRKIFALKGGGNNQDFYCYDILDSTWTNLASIYDPAYYTTKRPKDGASIVYSEYDGLVYAILGNNTQVLLAYVPGEPPQGNYWRYINRIPPEYGEKGFKHGASIQCVDSILYIFRGNSTRDILRYNIARNEWLDKLEIPGTKNKVKAGGTSSYHRYSQSIYFFTGGNKQTLWKFSIITNSIDSIAEIPAGPNNKKIKSGTAIVTCGEHDPLYVLKGTNTNEFWAFAFWAPGSKCYVENNPINISPSEQSEHSTSISFTSKNFNKLQYYLPYRARVNLKLYSLSGSLIKVLKDKVEEPGNYEISLNNIKNEMSLACGVYIFKAKINNHAFVQKVIIPR